MRIRVLLALLACAGLLGCSRGPVSILSVTAVSPQVVSAGTTPTITVTGQQFSSHTAIELGTTVLPTTFVSATAMTAVLPTSLANTPGNYPLSVVDAEPAQQGGTATLTTAYSISVIEPAPALASVAPAVLRAGTPSATLTLTGSGFTTATTLTINGTAHAATLQDAQHLLVVLTAGDLLYAQPLSLIVTNPMPGGGNSSPAVVQITNYTKAAQQYSAYGDSITYGYQLASVTSAYPYLLAAANGLQLTDRGVIGDMACDTFKAIDAQRDGYAPQSGPLFTYMIGTNETYVKGAGAYEAVFNQCDQAVLAWLALPSSAKVQAGSPTLQATGACSNAPYGDWYGASYCSGAGAISDQAFATYGAPLYLWIVIADTAPANATTQVTVDGSTVGTYPVAPNPAISTLNGGNRSIALVRVPVAAGIHAVTVTANAQGVGLLALGTVPASRAALPPLVVGDVPWQRDYSPVAPVSTQLAYSADVRANVALLQGDGLDIRFAPDRSYMLGTNAEMADAIHPNELGQQHLQAAFQTGLVALNTMGGLVAQVEHGTTTLSAAALLAVEPGTEAATYALPTGADGLVTIRNRSTKHAALIQLPGGEHLADGSVALQLGPEETLTLHRQASVSGVGGDVWRVVRLSPTNVPAATP